MPQRTSTDVTMTRAELASYLAALAEEFEGDSESVSVGVGNKTVTLEPPEDVSVSIDVVERSSRLRGRRETVEIELSWNP